MPIARSAALDSIVNEPTEMTSAGVPFWSITIVVIGIGVLFLSSSVTAFVSSWYGLASLVSTMSGPGGGIAHDTKWRGTHGHMNASTVSGGAASPGSQKP